LTIVRHSHRIAYLALAAVCLFWGTTYLGIRIALETLPPVYLIGIRYLISSTILLVAARVAGIAIPRERTVADRALRRNWHRHRQLPSRGSGTVHPQRFSRSVSYDGALLDGGHRRFSSSWQETAGSDTGRSAHRCAAGRHRGCRHSAAFLPELAHVLAALGRFGWITSRASYLRAADGGEVGRRADCVGGGDRRGGFARDAGPHGTCAVTLRSQRAGHAYQRFRYHSGLHDSGPTDVGTATAAARDRSRASDFCSLPPSAPVDIRPRPSGSSLE